ncbi:hypothetical protein DPMN_022175 [Dreissena polymorpha]|uniref:Uncharacterized protein n=1 Tax=Dreissena polymorpha TaxID=45954 RepID=A0A9D4NQ05_DREPO|nr:hypothetical protein DPMN_022175 [Dreissena polymorpha]
MAPPCGHVFQPTKTISKLVQDIIDINIQTEFHDDWRINVASLVLTRKKYSAPLRPYIHGTNLFIKFHKDRTLHLASGYHVYKYQYVTWFRPNNFQWTKDRRKDRQTDGPITICPPSGA